VKISVAGLGKLGSSMAAPSPTTVIRSSADVNAAFVEAVRSGRGPARLTT
jgi:hypothetical protein